MDAEVLWILVMNTSRAQILRDATTSGESDRRRLALRADRRRLAALLDAPDMLLPGRAAGRAARRAAWHRALEADHAAFVKQIVDLLEAHRIAGDFSRLAVFAAPRVLNRLRSVMPRHLREVVAAEVAENVIDLPFPLMRQRIAALLAARGIANIDRGESR